MKLPNRWVRRILLWPLPVILLFLTLTTVPLLALVALAVSPRLPGKLRLLRALGLAIVYLAVEAAVTVSALILWVASGFGWKLRSERFVEAHYFLLRASLWVLVVATTRFFSLSIASDGPVLPSDDGDPSTIESPLIVMSRHAGPADSLLLLHEVMSWKGRRPRIVAKHLLQFDPAIDIVLNRLPSSFIEPGGAAPDVAVGRISAVATGMTNRDAFVIFPEGGNFSEQRRVRAIERLREGGYAEAAERAARLRNVMPPRPAGTIAALDACPTADAVFVAHTGLEEIATVADLWAAIPERKTIHMTWTVVAHDHLPRGRLEREELLFSAWEAIDDWIDHRRSRNVRPLESGTSKSNHRPDIGGPE